MRTSINIAAKNLALPQFKNKIIPNKKKNAKNGKVRFKREGAQD